MKKKQILFAFLLTIMIGSYGFSQSIVTTNPEPYTVTSTPEDIESDYNKNLKSVAQFAIAKKETYSKQEKEKRKAVFVGPQSETCFLGFVTIRYTVIWNDGTTTVEGGTYFCGCWCS